VSETLLADLTDALAVEIFAGRVAVLLWLCCAVELGSEAEVEAFERAQELHEDPTLVRAVRLFAALKQHDLEHGPDIAAAALAADDDERILILAANVRFDAEGADAAVAMLRESVDAGASDLVRVGLGLLLVRAGRDADAVAELEEVVDEDADARALWTLGVARALSGDLRGGLAALERAREALEAPDEELDEAIEAALAALADEDDGDGEDESR
jgi:tetratricopeptide (TPR) repeat protein